MQEKKLALLKRKYVAMFLIGWMTFHLLGGNVSATNWREIKHLLIITSYDGIAYEEKEIVEGIKHFLLEEKEQDYMDVKVAEVNLHAKHLKTDEGKEVWFSALDEAYRYQALDGVIVVGDEALLLMEKAVMDEQSSFYHLPVVYTGVSERHYRSEEAVKYITGVVRTENKLELVRLVRKLHPQTKNIMFIVDNTIYGEVLVRDVKYLTRFLDEEITLDFIKTNYAAQVFKGIKQTLKEDYVYIIVGDFFSLNKDEVLASEELVKEIKRMTGGPLYTFSLDYMNNGATGGLVNRAEVYGKVAADYMMAILSGTPVEELAIIDRVMDEYVFNYKDIYTYNLDIKHIPKQSVLLNKSPVQMLISPALKAIILSIYITVFVLVGAVVHNFYKQKQAAKKSQRLYRITKEREELKTIFITNMSHELRTPLNIILSTTQLMDMEYRASDYSAMEKRLKHINQNANRLLKIVNNLIDITKFESGYRTLKKKNYNIVEVVENTFSECIPYGQQKGLRMIFDTEEEEMIVALDKEKIERVILNLLSNAIKFTPVEGMIEVYLRSKADVVEILVKDTGVGMKQEDIDHIFCRFYQIDNSLTRGSEGSGIGLCIVEEIIEMHEGKLHVQSTVGKGTSFRIDLPMQKLEGIQVEQAISDLELAVKREMADLE